MVFELYDLTAADEDERSTAIEPVRLPVNSTALTKPSATNRHAEFDVRDNRHFSRNNSGSNERVGQQKTAKIPPRTRILSVAAELFLRRGIAGVSVEAIAKAAAATKPTLYRHLVSRAELVARYLREAAKRLDACWAKIGPSGSASAPVQLGSWFTETSDGLVNGWACQLANAAAALKKRSHPARRVIKAYKALQRQRLTRLCRAAGLRNPSRLAHALLLCITALSVAGRIDFSFRFFLVGKAMITAQAKVPSARRQVQHP